MTAMRSVVLGCGHYLPSNILSNAELAAKVQHGRATPEDFAEFARLTTETGG